MQTSLFAQHGAIYFPSDLIFNPLDAQLRWLKVKSVEQSYYEHYLELDSLYSEFPRYVFNYDSTGKIKTFNYDFQNDFYADDLLAQGKKHDRQGKIYTFTDRKGKVKCYNFYQQEFIYQNGHISMIKTNKPVSSDSDKIFFDKSKGNQQCIEYIKKGHLLIQTKTYNDGQFYSETFFSYKTFYFHEEELNLLLSIVEKSADGCVVEETNFKYTFY